MGVPILRLPKPRKAPKSTVLTEITGDTRSTTAENIDVFKFLSRRLDHRNCHTCLKGVYFLADLCLRWPSRVTVSSYRVDTPVQKRDLLVEREFFAQVTASVRNKCLPHLLFSLQPTRPYGSRCLYCVAKICNRVFCLFVFVCVRLVLYIYIYIYIYMCVCLCCCLLCLFVVFI